MRLLANDRSIVIKRLISVCVVVWDCEDYIADFSKQFYESVYVKFKDKTSQNLAEKSIGLFKGFKQKCKINEKQLKYFTIEYKKPTNLGKTNYFLRSIKGCMMSLGDQFYRIVEHQQKSLEIFR